MLVLHAHGAIGIIALIPERLDVSPAKHVAIHEQGPALVPHQVGHQKTGEGKRGALLGIPLAPKQALSLQLRRHQRRDRQRNTAVLIKAVDQNVGRRPLPRVVADENGDRLADSRHGASLVAVEIRR